MDGLSPFNDYVNSQYYYNFYEGYSGNAYVLNTIYYVPTVLRAGTIDRIGVEATTAAATAIIRCGIYTTTSGLSGSLVAEASSTADASTTGVKDLTDDVGLSPEPTSRQHPLVTRDADAEGDGDRRHKARRVGGPAPCCTPH